MYAVIDIETTGLDPWRNEILTVSTVILDVMLDEVTRWTGRIRPEHIDYWSDDAQKIHGISKEMAASFDDSRDVLDAYISILDEYSTGGYSFICHALPVRSNIDLFDRNFIFAWMWSHRRRADYYRLFPEDRMRSTILKSRKKAQKQWGITSQSLSAWMTLLDIDQSRHHDSEFDAWICAEILRYQEGYRDLLYAH